MRYIDADLLLAQCRRNPLFEKTEKDKGMMYIERSIIDDTPTADVVEVVRCRDCKYFKMAGRTPICNFYKGLATTVSPQTDYCSYGLRREE